MVDHRQTTVTMEYSRDKNEVPVSHASPVGGVAYFVRYLLTLHIKLATALRFLHYAYPSIVCIYFLACLTVTVCTLQTQKLRARDAKVRRNVMLAFIALVACLYVCFIFQLP